MALPVVQPRPASGLEEEAAFRAFGFDPAELIMPAVIADWVNQYRIMRAANQAIEPLVNPLQADVATGRVGTFTFGQRVTLAVNNLTNNILAAVPEPLRGIPFKKILIGVAIGVGVIGVALLARSSAQLVTAIKE